MLRVVPVQGQRLTVSGSLDSAPQAAFLSQRSRVLREMEAKCDFHASACGSNLQPTVTP